MLAQQLTLLVILATGTTLYASHRLPFEATSILIIASLALTGLLPPEQALSGFSSTATLTVGAMFVLSGGLVRTGALEAVTFSLARFSQGSPRRLLVMLAVIVPIASAFVNDTPVVVMMVPVVLSLCRQFGVRPSKVLIPLSYLAVLGGTLTLLGTSTNILLDDLYRKAGGPGFGMFTFTPLGLIYVVAGAFFLVLFSYRLLPSRASLSDLMGDSQPSTYVTEIAVNTGSDLVGKRVADVFDRVASVLRRPETPQPARRHRRLRRELPASNPEDQTMDSLELVEVFRDDTGHRGDRMRSLQLAAGDVLLVTGMPQTIARFLETTKSELALVLEDDRREPLDATAERVVEAVVLPDSRLNGQLVGDLELHQLYEVGIMGVQHRGRQLIRGLRNIRLNSGDVLLLRGESANLHAAALAEQLLVVEGVDRSIARRQKNRIALLIMLGVIGLATLTPIPIVVLALTGAALMVVTRCLRADEALRALQPSTLLLLIAAIPLGMALESTGLAQVAVDQLLRWFGDVPPLIFVSFFYLLTNLLAQVISAKAVAVLLLPIALSLSTSLGIHPTPLVISIAFGTAAGFLTPIGHQVNAIVMGPGGYTFADYIRVGLPMTILMWLMATVFIPIIWPL